MRLLSLFFLLGGPPADAPSERFALVRTYADLYTAPRPDAPRLNPYATPERARGRPEVTVHRLVGERDGWLELETLPRSAWAAHCGRGLYGLETMRLRVFARAADRVPATARPVRVAWDDGTAVELAPGVPLYALGKGRWRAHPGPATLSLPLPDDAVGDHYAPGEGFGWNAGGPSYLRDGAVRSGALRLKDGRVAAASDLPVPPLFPRATRPAGADVVATLDLRCARVDARVRADLLRTSHAARDAPAPAADPGPVTLPGRPRVRAGAEAWWPDGTPAGRTEALTTFDIDAAVAAHGRRCLQKPLRWIRRGERHVDARNRLVLCFVPEDVGE